MFETLYNQTTLEGLKKEYRKLAIKYHPDHYRDDGKAFIALQEAFEALHDKLKSNDKDAWKHKETATDFMDIVNAIMKFNINIEIIGSWIYASGEGTYSIKDQLKELKFWWSKKHKSWIYSGQQGRTRRRATNYNPRNLYNTEVIKTQKKIAYNK